jgi:hypothetical protein
MIASGNGNDLSYRLPALHVVSDPRFWMLDGQKMQEVVPMLAVRKRIKQLLALA